MKKCKGTGVAKGYGCNTPLPFTKRNGLKSYKSKYGLGIDCKCYQKWLVSTNEGKEKMQAAALKATKPRREFEEFEKEEKERKSLNTLLTNTKNACHTYIKARDKGKPCISCGVPYRSDFQAGHCFKSELFSTIRFHENNIHGQCIGCNIHKDGNEAAYISRLPERIGKEKVVELLKLSKLDKKIDHKWDREQLIEVRKYYQKKLKELKNGESI
jgi:hypothetical protein